MRTITTPLMFIFFNLFNFSINTVRLFSNRCNNGLLQCAVLAAALHLVRFVPLFIYKSFGNLIITIEICIVGHLMSGSFYWCHLIFGFHHFPSLIALSSVTNNKFQSVECMSQMSQTIWDCTDVNDICL